MIRPLLVLGCLLLAALPVRAQEQKWEAFGGYQFTHFQTPAGFSGPSKTNGNGWDGAFGYSINNWLGVKADFSGSYGNGGTQLGVSNGPANLYTYTFGPTFSAPASPNVRFFVEFLAGGTTTMCSTSRMSLLRVWLSSPVAALMRGSENTWPSVFSMQIGWVS